jgi:GDP-L-fucose synthase
MNFDLRGKRVFVAGHRGMVGSALVRRLASEDCKILTVGREAVDLRDQRAVFQWFDEQRPQAVFLAAARVGGIYANNTQPGDFLYDNLVLQTNVIEAARQVKVDKLMFIGSSSIYPRLAPQPIPEGCLLSGPLEPTIQWYAVAKIAALKLCEAYRRQHGCDFVSVTPTNLYGPGDNFDPLIGHVLQALIVKIHDAVRYRRPAIELWGTGRPRREFLHVDDLADAAVFLMKNWSEDEHINIGTGEDLTITDLAGLISKVAGFDGRFVFDPSKPDGTPRRLLDVSKLTALGWRHRIDLETGIRQTYKWYIAGEGIRRTALS